ncbi:hypothetical protein T440DRAFT_129946 [Plenodomus tracheiphilus IPT5]|uniref:Uncharacterized protein n=1 Tax=Plenodomus tracheiphilus IPT5 TaxID=1408161 RepID=A0A6A7B2Z5_9PLEO|nr:hypothetical protein T440DRAFT_129946 [Plenodomus tracheiphilus IPT5]
MLPCVEAGSGQDAGCGLEYVQYGAPPWQLVTCEWWVGGLDRARRGQSRQWWQWWQRWQRWQRWPRSGGGCPGLTGTEADGRQLRCGCGLRLPSKPRPRSNCGELSHLRATPTDPQHSTASHEQATPPLRQTFALRRYRPPCLEQSRARQSEAAAHTVRCCSAPPLPSHASADPATSPRLRRHTHTHTHTHTRPRSHPAPPARAS